MFYTILLPFLLVLWRIRRQKTPSVQHRDESSSIHLLYGFRTVHDQSVSKICNDEKVQLFTDHLSVADDIAKRRAKFIYQASVSSTSIMHFSSNCS